LAGDGIGLHTKFESASHRFGRINHYTTTGEDGFRPATAQLVWQVL
jgi:hypothetical protein